MGRYGSLNNLMMDRTQSKQPEVGMGATLLGWSDRCACTIIAISPSGKTLTIQRDTATRADRRGMTDAQSWTYERNPNGTVYTARLKKNGKWQTPGGTTFLIGHRHEFYDFSF
jgi:hypothetical protein